MSNRLQTLSVWDCLEVYRSQQPVQLLEVVHNLRHLHCMAFHVCASFDLVLNAVSGKTWHQSLTADVLADTSERNRELLTVTLGSVIRHPTTTHEVF